MSLTATLKRWLGTEELYSLYPERYDKPFFRDKSIQQQIKERGYAVADLIDQPAIDALYKGFDEITAIMPEVTQGEFWNSGRAASTEVRNIARRYLDTYVKDKLKDFFDLDHVEFMGGVYVAKPPSAESALSPHQDSSHVDEREFMSVYCWTTLTDTTVENGAIHAIPGSHKFGNLWRSLNVPWQFSGYEELLKEYSVPVPMKAGQVFFFDSACIHSSPPNYTDTLRLATNYYVKPKASPILHHYVDETTPKGQVEVFSVDADFYYNYDFESRPPEIYPKLGTEPAIDLHLSEAKLRRMCENAMK